MRRLFGKKSSKDDPKDSIEAWSKESRATSPTSAPLPSSHGSAGSNNSIRGASSPRSAGHSANDQPPDSLGELKAKYGNLGASAGSFKAPPSKKSTSGVSNGPLKGSNGPLKGSDAAPGVSAALARAQADAGPRMLGGGSADKKKSFFGAAPPIINKKVADSGSSDLLKLGQELSLRRAKKQAADRKRQLLDRLER
jgi:hypothetical protein